ncbi:putative RNase H-like nuclease (RuvC/YqgF family) [Algoriphagus sp. 4150]|uniref:hypothetical protein n=1 Tax=Algoriphagus sp. 4150 TaxID=2817756 RepID=UPI002856C30E|nr:hypothetical protein [Algoriphagus sp. 4150]MDR7131117.1 putative RNase H-like nuclease (RuvC/YqgF family) [Algoriphagus sp. 4150]
MKNILFLLFSLFIFSCSGNNDERSRIEKEKERLKIESQAREELQHEKEIEVLNQELLYLTTRLENLFRDLHQTENETEKLELKIQIEVLSERIFKTDNLFLWLEKPPELEYEIIKSFKNESNLMNETENIAKSKLYLEAKKLKADGIISLDWKGKKVSTFKEHLLRRNRLGVSINIHLDFIYWNSLGFMGLFHIFKYLLVGFAA